MSNSVFTIEGLKQNNHWKGKSIMEKAVINAAQNAITKAITA
jgi:hypothetical protein